MSGKLAFAIFVLMLFLAGLACQSDDGVTDGPIPGCTPVVYERDENGDLYNPCWR